MMTRPFICLALAVAFGSTSATAADVRSSSPAINIGPRGVTSMGSAAAATVPSAAAGTQETDSVRGSAEREAKHDAMLKKLLAERRASMGPAALAANAAIALPHIPGLPVSNNGGAFGFKGLSNFDQAGVNEGFSAEPPDQALCVGNGFIFEGVNDAFAVYSEHGALLLGPVQANAFFGVPFELFVSDPKCIYDKASNRWFVTMIEYPNDLSKNHLEIAVSQTGDPRGAFNLYDIDVTHDGSDFVAHDCPCLGDQPLIGADANGFYISTNSFGVTTFEGAQVYALSKKALASGAHTPVVHFDQLSSRLGTVEVAISIQPSITPPGIQFAPDTEFLAQSMLAKKRESQLVVWTVNNTSNIDTDADALTMSLAVMQSEVYVQPVPAEQKPGPTPRAETSAITDTEPGPANEQDLDGGDQRLQQVMYRDGQLWTTLGTASVSDGTPVRDAAAWFVINVSNSPKQLSANIAAQGYVAGPDSSHLLYPALAVNAAGQAAMVFTLTGPDFFPSAASWRFGTHSSIHKLFEGREAQDGAFAYLINRPRWGDYSAAAVGPNGSIWLATEMIPGGVRKPSANWGTFISRSP
jgi:hypothetical protein